MQIDCIRHVTLKAWVTCRSEANGTIRHQEVLFTPLTWISTGVWLCVSMTVCNWKIYHTFSDAVLFEICRYLNAHINGERTHHIVVKYKCKYLLSCGHTNWRRLEWQKNVRTDQRVFCIYVCRNFHVCTIVLMLSG